MVFHFHVSSRESNRGITKSIDPGQPPWPDRYICQSHSLREVRVLKSEMSGLRVRGFQGRPLGPPTSWCAGQARQALAKCPWTRTKLQRQRCPMWKTHTASISLDDTDLGVGVQSWKEVRARVQNLKTYYTIYRYITRRPILSNIENSFFNSKGNLSGKNLSMSQAGVLRSVQPCSAYSVAALFRRRKGSRTPDQSMLSWSDSLSVPEK